MIYHYINTHFKQLNLRICSTMAFKQQRLANLRQRDNIDCQKIITKGMS